ncbi:MAG: hypothetical protein AB7G11_15010 [Phycisphaerales bacterium]
MATHLIALSLGTVTASAVLLHWSGPPPAGPFSTPTQPARDQQPEPLPTLDVMRTDFPAELQNLAEQFQPAAAKAPGTANAWPTLMEAAATMHRLWRQVLPPEGAPDDAPVPDFNFLRDPDGDPQMPADRKQATIRLTRDLMAKVAAAGVLEQLAAVRHSPRFVRSRLDSPQRRAELTALGTDEPWDGRLVLALLPELGVIRNIARMNAVRMMDAASAGDWPAFTDAMEVNFALARAATHQTTLIDRLVGIAIQSLTIQEAMNHIGSRRPPDDTLDMIRAALDRQLADLPPLDFQLRGERLFQLDCCRWVFSNAGELDLRQLAHLTGGSPGDTPAVVRKASREANVRVIEELSLKCRRYAALPAPQRRAAQSPDAWLEEHKGADTLLAGVLLPAVGKACASDDQIAIHREGFKAVIAIERFHRQTGGWPASWDDLISRHLLPAPPPDPVSGQTLRYKRLDKPGATGAEYLVYSVGADGEDNGGVEIPSESEGNRYFALNGSPHGKGFDFIINRR